jgi:hypothetical protein
LVTRGAGGQIHVGDEVSLIDWRWLIMIIRFQRLGNSQ